MIHHLRHGASPHDQIADVDRQSRRLHEEIPQSELTILPGLGHMVHHLAPDQVIKAIDRAAALADMVSAAQHAPAPTRRPAHGVGLEAA